MHPAPSLIVFSTLSGLGFGLLAMMGLGVGDTDGWAGLLRFALGFALAGGGLLSSTLHLGHPERALLAFTQWRTSWLSREAWAAVGALALSGLYAALTLAGTRIAPLGWLAALACFGTVASTAMIYAQLRTVPRWHHWSVPVLFLAYAATGGLVLSGAWAPALLMLGLTGLGQFAAWRGADARVARDPSTVGTATGLGGRGAVRPFENPHTGPNYLTREMAFRVARRHGLRLRSLALVFGFVAPALLLVLPGPAVVIVPLATLVHIGGVMLQRWLFFAEAEHVMALYYGP
ncbi:dibenzothiophene desulfurase [Palleronia sediminis]|uniref:Dibenzothiophene desulfurase n=1 Tax=Palleronia sediminis TaxID=2547833 RepID=A0A4V3BA17_9RHOB|nr:DmsC/YnfH family molybdoenzyme membrane anchor subunit [Palleronia sediminis]TDL81389.1 dibenzothiophene desulfurase [Palleronia sediminis]